MSSKQESQERNREYEPLAAASIRQVHRAVLKYGSDVVMKIQYPWVAASIESDIENVRLLLAYTNLIPKGLLIELQRSHSKSWQGNVIMSWKQVTRSGTRSCSVIVRDH